MSDLVICDLVNNGMRKMWGNFMGWVRALKMPKLFKKDFKQIIKEQLLNPSESDALKAFSIGFGVFMGIVPIWGFQMAAAIGLAFVLKLNKTLVLLAANISIPPLIPVIIYAGIQLGSFLLGEDPISFDENLSLDTAKNHLQAHILGGVTLAFLSAIFLGSLAFVLIKFFTRERK